jgi:hypothetical protein
MAMRIIAASGRFALSLREVIVADATEPVSTVRNYINAFNRGDAKAMAATFAPQSSILDGMAPHVWVGPTASQDWYRDVLAEGERHGASEYRVTLDEPRHVNVTGDAAYVVVPATMTFNLKEDKSRKLARFSRRPSESSRKAGALRHGHGRKAFKREVRGARSIRLPPSAA